MASTCPLIKKKAAPARVRFSKTTKGLSSFDEYTYTPHDFQLDAELKWDAFAEAKRISLEDHPDNIIAAKHATRLHLEFMDTFIAWAKADERVAA